MHRFIWNRLSVTLVERSTASTPTSKICSSLQSLRLLSSISTTSDDSDRTDSDNCANQELEPSNRASSVIRLFQDCGFSQIQAESIVSRYPSFLGSFNPEETFRSKIIFFHSIGIPEADVAKMVTICPRVLHRSLNNHIIPTFDLLKTLLGGEENAIAVVKRRPFILSSIIRHKMAANLSTLRNHGVPMSDTIKMMTRSKCTEVLERSKPDWFGKVLESVMKMGFDTSSLSFGNAVSAMGLCNESTWEEKIKFYEGLGFSREELFSMFKRQPLSLCLSRKNVKEAVEFYIDKFHWGAPEFVDCPVLLMYSLHKRVIPRCSVLQLLCSRKMIKDRRLKLVTFLHMTEKVFLREYVTKYQNELPEVLDAYHGKLSFDEFTFVSGKNREVKAV